MALSSIAEVKPAIKGFILNVVIAQPKTFDPTPDIYGLQWINYPLARALLCYSTGEGGLPVQLFFSHRYPCYLVPAEGELPGSP